MTTRTSTLVWICLATACVGTAVAQSSGGDFTITRQVVSGGGSVASGDGITAVATAGQASVDVATGGEFAVRSGFHVPAEIDAVFSDGFEGATP